jgi:hypothetical protein
VSSARISIATTKAVITAVFEGVEDDRDYADEDDDGRRSTDKSGFP